jgi:hypothetical protein
MPWRDTRLEAQGAEFLVLGQLLARGIQAYKAYINYPGYDLIAVSKDGERTCRVQVKSRWATNWGRGFPIKNFDCDYVVVVALNRGPKRVREPEYWVLPVAEVEAAQRSEGGWEKAYLRDIEDADSYQAAWSLIDDFLAPRRPRPARRGRR